MRNCISHVRRDLYDRRVIYVRCYRFRALRQNDLPFADLLRVYDDVNHMLLQVLKRIPETIRIGNVECLDRIAFRFLKS